MKNLNGFRVHGYNSWLAGYVVQATDSIKVLSDRGNWIIVRDDYPVYVLEAVNLLREPPILRREEVSGLGDGNGRG